ELAPQYAGGWNAIAKTNATMEDNGHGTHCAGTIGAADNGAGVIGVAPKVRLWAVKVLDAKGSGTSESVIRGIDWVLARKQELGLRAPGVDVVSTMRMGTGTIAFVGDGDTTLAGAELTGSPKASLSGNFVFCGLGKPAEFPSAVRGNIALIKRGELKFGEKVKNAKAAGASAVVIFNNDTSAMNWTLIGDDPADKTFAFPLTVGVSLADGTWLQEHAADSITVAFRADDYGMMSGTSMA